MDLQQEKHLKRRIASALKMTGNAISQKNSSLPGTPTLVLMSLLFSLPALAMTSFLTDDTNTIIPVYLLTALYLLVGSYSHKETIKKIRYTILKNNKVTFIDGVAEVGAFDLVTKGSYNESKLINSIVATTLYMLVCDIRKRKYDKDSLIELLRVQARLENKNDLESKLKKFYTDSRIDDVDVSVENTLNALKKLNII